MVVEAISDDEEVCYEEEEPEATQITQARNNSFDGEPYETISGHENKSTDKCEPDDQNRHISHRCDASLISSVYIQIDFATPRSRTTRGAK